MIEPIKISARRIAVWFLVLMGFAVAACLDAEARQPSAHQMGKLAELYAICVGDASSQKAIEFQKDYLYVKSVTRPGKELFDYEGFIVGKADAHAVTRPDCDRIKSEFRRKNEAYRFLSKKIREEAPK